MNLALFLNQTTCTIIQSQTISNIWKSRKHLFKSALKCQFRSPKAYKRCDNRTILYILSQQALREGLQTEP